jgi:hypothetical protein
MTTYRQNVPEQIFVSPDIYVEVLTHLDPFARASKPVKPECGHFRLAPYGCENCFASHEEIARERAFEDEIEFARR